MRRIIVKNRDIILLTIGSLLVVLSLCLLFYDRIELIKSNVFAEVEMEKYHENNLDGEGKDEEISEEVDANTENVINDENNGITEEDNK